MGLGLQLDPLFFELSRRQKKMGKYGQIFRSKHSLFIKSLEMSIFVARSFVPAQDKPVPVVLVAGPMYQLV